MKYAEYIKQIEIDSLWSGKRHVVWNLDRQVNILSGINGVGKSTILNKVVKGLAAGGESDVNRLGSLVATFEERAPRTERRLLADRFAHLAQNGCVQTLVLHVDRHFVYTGQVFALYHTVEVDIAESCHLLHYPFIQVFLGA